jgi:hypothetical protein
MKNSILFIGFLIIVLNTVAGLIISGYKPFNMVMADISLMLTVAAMYGSSISKMADGFKIGFTLLFSITGLIRLICSLVSSSDLKDNGIFIAFLVLLAIEAVCIFIGIALKNK